MRTVLSVAVTACCLLVAAAPAAAKSIPVDLRVEGADGKSLTADRYQTFPTRVNTTRRPPNCNGSGATRRLAGTTALGTLVDGALANPKLDPLLVSDEFDFGLMVCGVGGDNSGGASSFWLYKVNHVSPEVGADQHPVKPEDDVLWYFVEGSRNSGDELELVAPARVRPGEEFETSVTAYNFQGVRRPVPGATVAGGGKTATTDASGVARLTLDRSGNRTLRATLDPNIPSAPTKVCVNEDLSQCAAARGTRIWGSRRSDPIVGTSGPDRIRAGRGGDRIRVRRGSRDRVSCGAGRDRVFAGTQDRVGGDCEVVRYRGRR